MAAALLLTGGTQHAAERDHEHYSVKVKVKASNVVGGIRHAIRIQNKAKTAEIVSLVAAGYEGFKDPPISVALPQGWESRVVHWQGKGKNGKDQKRFAVVMTCDPDAWVDGRSVLRPEASGVRPCTDAQGLTHSLRPEDESEFEIVLPYESAGLIDGRVRVVFGDGHVLETPSQRSRIIGFPDQPGRKH